MQEPVSVLFVCLGNICRSTMAEGVFQNLVKQPQYEGKIGRIDSCGTGWWPMLSLLSSLLLPLSCLGFDNCFPTLSLVSALIRQRYFGQAEFSIGKRDVL